MRNLDIFGQAQFGFGKISLNSTSGSSSPLKHFMGWSSRIRSRSTCECDPRIHLCTDTSPCHHNSPQASPHRNSRASGSGSSACAATSCHFHGRTSEERIKKLTSKCPFRNDFENPHFFEITNISTHPSLQLLPDEWLEQLPDHVEEEGLLDDVHLLQSQWHSLLDKGEQTRGECGGERFDLFHRQSIKVHYHHHATNLRDQFELGGQVHQVEDAEQLIRADLLRIPRCATVYDEHATSFVIEVGQHVHDIMLNESPTLLLRHDSFQQFHVVLLELCDFAHLEMEDRYLVNSRMILSAASQKMVVSYRGHRYSLAST